MLTIVLLLIAFSLALALAITPVARGVALRLGLVDLPDNNRKIHRKPVARIGGLAIFVAYFGTCLALGSLSGRSRIDVHAALAALKSLAPGALVVFLVGLIDDAIGLKPWHKLAAEILAGVLVISAGIRIQGGPFLAAHPLIAAFGTLAWLVLCINAVNLIDGLDGLAAGIALLATLAILAGAVLRGSSALSIAAAPLVGALLGFLVFNFNPASIFLGDSGSLLIGLLLGCFAILWTGSPATARQAAVPVIALAVPLVDTTLAIVRRFLRAQPIFSPDRSHIHHRLLSRGFTHRRAVLVLYLAAATAGAASLCLMYVEKRWEPVLIAVVAAGVFFGIRRLGYAELETAAHILTTSAFLREVDAQLAVRAFEDKLLAATTPSQCWAVIEEASPQFGFHPTHMRFVGEMFGYGDSLVLSSSWDLRLPISQNDWIKFVRDPGPVPHASAMASFGEAICKVLGAKSDVFAPLIPRKAASAPSGGLLHGISSRFLRVSP